MPANAPTMILRNRFEKRRVKEEHNGHSAPTSHQGGKAIVSGGSESDVTFCDNLRTVRRDQPSFVAVKDSGVKGMEV